MVASAAPFTWTTLVLTNPEPFTVSDRALDPTITFVGLIDETVGIEVEVVPPPDSAGPGPQPLMETITPSVRTNAEKQSGDRHNHQRERTFIVGHYFPKAVRL